MSASNKFDFEISCNK